MIGKGQLLALAALFAAGRLEPAPMSPTAPTAPSAPAAAPASPAPPGGSAARPAPATAAAQALPAASAPGGAADRAMYGGTPARNMVSDATHLPSRWDPATGLNVKWAADLGSQSYGGPLVAGGKVFVGTNNQGKRNPKITGDRGVIMAFRAADGQFLWQAAHDKLSQGKVNDWPLQGICSTPAVEGNRLYYVSNRAELVCADTEGFRDGKNDGPFTAETETSEIDADFVWKLDMIGELGVYPHNQAASSPLVIDDLVYVVTGNGVDEGHINIPAPRAPSFLAVDKHTGKVVWQSSLPGEKILHGQWSSPSYGVLDGKPQVLFAGGDGWLYALEPKTGKVIWRFDCNPKDSVYTIGPGSTRNGILAMPVIAGDMVYVAVGEDPEHGEGIGHLWALRPRGEGDLTGKAVVWQRGGEDFHRSLSTVAVRDGLLFTADFSGYVYCLDAQTGKPYWVYNSYGAIWGSPLLADGKVYIGNEDGDVAVLRAARQLEVLSKINLGSAVFSTPVARDGVLYVTSRSKLFAIAEGIPEHKAAASADPASAAPVRPPR
ncbi:MAG TPA: PQQ-binding-like beta-propeller repeat protein [Thermoanaerobaculia bacterium]|nr:PQQ-binding-like beta-propeller repeat protein [Thermoanaerobaculia bacterium]